MKRIGQDFANLPKWFGMQWNSRDMQEYFSEGSGHGGGSAPAGCKSLSLCPTPTERDGPHLTPPLQIKLLVTKGIPGSLRNAKKLKFYEILSKFHDFFMEFQSKSGIMRKPYE